MPAAAAGDWIFHLPGHVSPVTVLEKELTIHTHGVWTSVVPPTTVLSVGSLISVTVFTARRYVSARTSHGPASVCQSVYLSQVEILSRYGKWFLFRIAANGWIVIPTKWR